MAPTTRESSTPSSPSYLLGSRDSVYENHDANAERQLVPRGESDNPRGTAAPNNDRHRSPRRNLDTPNNTHKNMADNEGLLNSVRQRGLWNKGKNLGLGNEIVQDGGIFSIVVAGTIIALAIVAAWCFKSSK
ncbi:hypothetical protein Hte_000271 [Hypoxylon texense]